MGWGRSTYPPTSNLQPPPISNLHPTPTSNLICILVALQLRQGMHDRALAKLQEAIALDPRNPLARFERSSVLMDLEMPEEALEELQRLVRLSPAEPSVYFQRGKALKKMGDLERVRPAGGRSTLGERGPVMGFACLPWPDPTPRTRRPISSWRSP